MKPQVRLSMNRHHLRRKRRQLIRCAGLHIAKSLRRIIVVKTQSAARPRNIYAVQQRVRRKLLVQSADIFLNFPVIAQPRKDVRRTGLHSSILRPGQSRIHVLLRFRCKPNIDFAHCLACEQNSAVFVLIPRVSRFHTVRESLTRLADLTSPA